MIQSTAVLNAPRHRTRLNETRLSNDRMELRLLPEFGCHWTRLRLSVKGEMVDFLLPVDNGDTLLDLPTGRGCYLLAPWSNRIPEGSFRFHGRTYAVQPNFGDGSAIHGDVRLRPWKVLHSSPTLFGAELDTRDFEDFNYPFSLRFHHSMQLLEDRLRVNVTTENRDDARVPVGLGFHPYFLRRPTWKDRDVYVVVSAEKAYPLEACLPTGPAVRVDTRNDLRELRPLGERHIDDCYTALTDPSLRLIYPSSRVEIRLDLDESFSHVIVHAPLSRDGTPSSFVAVEPLSHVTNGFNLHECGWKDTGVRILEPGESWTVTWSLSFGDI